MNTIQTEINGTIARVFIQCADKNGRVGDFLATNANRQVSPTFGTLVQLFDWARRNGWRDEAGAYVYEHSNTLHLIP